MIIHEQDANKVTDPFWDLTVTNNGDGIISIPAGKFYIQGKEYDLSAITNEPFTDGARLFVEKAGDNADYLIDLTKLAKGISFADRHAAIKVVWHEGGEIHHLRSVQI